VNDALRGWLELQRDLGGDHVVFDQPLRMAPTANGDKLPVKGRSAPATGGEPPKVPVRATPGDGSASAWRKNAPPVPEPGMIVMPPVSDAPAWATLDEVATTVASCIRCPLCRSRTKTVPGEGNSAAGLMCVGEGPGESEDLSGRPFVGRAGELLDKILENIETPRSTVFIANIVKCRPPKNRTPLPDEQDACLPYLHRQIGLIRPRVLLALGTTAATALLGVKKPLGELRNRVHRYDGIPLIVTYHPAALLRNPNWKRPAWDDVRIARQLLDLDV